MRGFFASMGFFYPPKTTIFHLHDPGPSFHSRKSHGFSGHLPLHGISPGALCLYRTEPLEADISRRPPCSSDLIGTTELEVYKRPCYERHRRGPREDGDVGGPTAHHFSSPSATPMSFKFNLRAPTRGSIVTHTRHPSRAPRQRHDNQASPIATSANHAASSPPWPKGRARGRGQPCPGPPPEGHMPPS